MPLLGSHLSIAGGLYKAANAAGQLGMQTVQIFTGSPSQWSVTAVAGKAKSTPTWKRKELAEEDVRLFKAAVRENKLQSPCAHDSYLINLASPDDDLWNKSIEAFVGELERAEALGLVGVVTHPGSYVDSSEEAGLKKITEAFNEIHRRTAGFQVETWLEVTAGQGTNLGNRFEHLGTIIQNVAQPERFGVCLDTCHLYAAGYDLRTKSEYQKTMQQLDEHIGLNLVRAFHLNDSKKELGTRVDRHDHIGEGCMGLEPFRFVMNDPKFQKLPMYLETKKEKRDGEEMDAVNLRTLRSLMKTA